MAFIDICMLRAGPQDLPASRFLFVLMLVIYIAISLVLSLIELEMPIAAVYTGLDVVLVLALAAGMFWVSDKWNRFNQTATALLGIGTIFNAAAAPLLLWQQAVADGENPMPLPSFMLLALMIWNLVVIGHVIRHALSTTMFWGIAIAMIYTFVSMSIFRVMFNAPT